MTTDSIVIAIIPGTILVFIIAAILYLWDELTDDPQHRLWADMAKFGKSLEALSLSMSPAVEALRQFTESLSCAGALLSQQINQFYTNLPHENRPDSGSPTPVDIIDNRV
jgi:hypothetical protein